MPRMIFTKKGEIAIMVKKALRSVKVYEQSGYNYQPTPTIILKGKWLEESGFDIGRCLQVRCEEGKLVITIDEAKEKLIEAEHIFAEKRKKEMKEELRKQKELFCAQYVAEEKAGYMS